MKARLLAIPFKRLIWLPTLLFALHEAEEWNIMQWWGSVFVDATVLPDRAVYVWLVGISLLAILWTLMASLLPSPEWTARLMLPPLVLMPFANAIQHVYWQLAFGGYAPGIVTSVLVIPAVLLVSWQAHHRKLLSIPFQVVTYATALPTIIVTIVNGRHESEMFRVIYALTTWADGLLFGSP